LIASLPELQPEIIDADRVGLFGHSRGGGVSILATREKELRGRIRAVVTWAAVSTFDRLGETETALWREQGEMPIVNMRTGQELAVGVEVLDDVQQNAERLTVVTAAQESPAPILIVHGDQDETVPVAEGRALAATGPANLLELKGAGHTFGAVHPFAGPTPELIQALNATQRWFRKYLG
jgi:dipeptidyl aminopeptidase/acylaminoacyl peptidase